MADLYLDNDVSLALARPLRAAGHRVTAARDLGHFRAGDDAQLLTARSGWVLVTYNRRDFAMLHDAWQTWAVAFGSALPPHPGILVLDHAPPAAQAGAVVSLLAAPGGPLANELLWWHRGGGWSRRLVGGGWATYP